MSITLANNEQASFASGQYIYKADGALDIQLQLYAEGFATVEGGGLTTAGNGVIVIDGDIKVINAGANTLTLKRSGPI